MQNKHEIWELRQMQALPLESKIKMTKHRIQTWIDEFGVDGVYVSFSGGKDSTVLVDIVRNVCGYREIPLVFVDTGLEYPEIREFSQRRFHSVSQAEEVICGGSAHRPKNNDRRHCGKQTAFQPR